MGHSVIELSLTMNWIYNQMVNLTAFEPIVIVREKIDKDTFPLEHVYCFNDHIGVRVLRKFSRSRIDLRCYYHSYVLKKMDVSLLHSHFGNRGFLDLEIIRRLKIPHITTFYGFDLSRLPKQEPIWREKYARLFDKCDLFLVEGRNMKSCLMALGCPESKIVVHHIGVDLSEIPFSQRKIDSKGQINILAAATFTEKKGLPYAIEAFAIVKSRCPDLDLRFTLIGDIPTSLEPRFLEVKDEILGVIDRYNIVDFVDLLGYVSHYRLIEEALKAHVFISPSVTASDGDTEGGAPVAITEMSASGMPILSTFHCDIPEVVIDGETGFLVAERDVEALAGRLEYLVTHPELWNVMGKKGRLYVEREYDLSEQVRKLENIYSTMV